MSASATKTTKTTKTTATPVQLEIEKPAAEAVTNPAGPAPLAAIADLPATFADGSAIMDRGGLAQAFASYVKQFATWNPADLAATKASRTAAIAEIRMRARVIRPDGTPMLAGDCDAWRAIYTDRIYGALKSLENFDSARLKRFQGSVRTYRTNRGLTHAIMAERLVAMSKDLAANPDRIAAVEDEDERERLQDLSELATTPIVRLVPAPTDDNPAATVEVIETVEENVLKAMDSENEGTPVPDAVKRLLNPVYAGQKTLKGERLQGFETVPEVWGPRPKITTTPDSAATVTAASETVKSSFDKLRGALAIAEVMLAAPTFAEDLYRLGTAYGDALIGDPESRGRFKSNADRAGTCDTLDKLSEYLGVLSGYYRSNGKDDNLPKTQVDVLRWKGDES